MYKLLYIVIVILTLHGLTKEQPLADVSYRGELKIINWTDITFKTYFMILRSWKYNKRTKHNDNMYAYSKYKRYKTNTLLK